MLRIISITCFVFYVFLFGKPLAAEIPSDWSSSSTYSTGDLVIYNGLTYQAWQNIPPQVTPGTDASSWKSLHDLAENQSAPGTPPVTAPDSDEVNDIGDSGSPGPIVTLLSNIDLPDLVSEEWADDKLKLRAVAPTGHVFFRWESNQAAINGSNSKTVDLDELKITGSEVIAVAHFVPWENSFTGASSSDANVTGWMESDWLGTFYDAGNGWVYHLKHGWMYLAGGDSSSAWTWVDGLDWVWLEKNVYPHMYMEDQGNWLWHAEDEDGDSFYYDYKETAWMTHGSDERTWWRNPGKVPSKKIAYDQDSPVSVTEYDSYGNKDLEESFLNGERHGMAKYLAPDGAEYALTWKNGSKSDGWFVEGNSDGTYSAKEYQQGYVTGNSKDWHASGSKSFEATVAFDGLNWNTEEKSWDESGTLAYTGKNGQIIEGEKIKYWNGLQDTISQVYDGYASYDSPLGGFNSRMVEVWASGELTKREAWYPNDKPALSVSYRNGVRHGNDQAWRENTRQWWKDSWNNGALTQSSTWYANGQQETWIQYNPSTQRVDARVWYDNGESLMTFKARGFDQAKLMDFAYNSNFEQYLSSYNLGVQDIQSLIDDLASGNTSSLYRLESFYEDIKYLTKDIVTDQPINMWWENGKLMLKASIQNGLLYGPFTFKYANGQLGISGTFDQNGKGSNLKVYDPQGRRLDL